MSGNTAKHVIGRVGAYFPKGFINSKNRNNRRHNIRAKSQPVSNGISDAELSHLTELCCVCLAVFYDAI